MKRIRTAIGCFMFLTARAFSENAPDDHVLQTVSFPKGGLLVWIAHLNDSIHADGLAEEIAFVPVLPRIEIAADMTNDLILAKWVGDVRMLLMRSLCLPEPAWSVLLPRDRLTADFIKVGDLLDLFQTLYGCRIVRKEKNLFVYPFPDQLRLLGYSDVAGKKRSGLNFVVGQYTAHRPGHVFVHEDAMTGKVYVLAPDGIHNKVLAEINTQVPLKTGLCVKGLPPRDKSGETPEHQDKQKW